jgi:hypothetical protein
LAAFSNRFLTDKYGALPKPIPAADCPTSSCLAFEIVSNKLYPEEGGAHIIAIFYASEQPEYPGVRFEAPAPPPKPSAADKSGGPTFYRASGVLQRLPGTLYTIAVLDSNADIFAPALGDFKAFMKSVVVDSK